MNEVLKKCIDELAKPAPSVPYVRGMLETLLAMNGGMNISDQSKPFIPPVSMPKYTPPPSTDEGGILDAAAAAKLASVKNLSEASLQ